MRAWVIGAGLAILAGIGVLLGGVSLLPVSVGLGPCLKDYTANPTYHPRSSPLATVRFKVGGADVEACYGRPSARGRVVYGVLVPYDSLWRTGANEPTRLYTNAPIEVAGIPVPAGRYSLYTMPRQGPWTLYLSRSTRHWGNDISAAVRAQEVGHALVSTEPLAEHVETLTVHPQAAGDTVKLLLDWEQKRVIVPITASRPGAPAAP